MPNISVVILTKNEELHIQRCIENIYSISKEIFIIDSYSTDKTIEIAKRYPKVQVLQHIWENNHAKQFNWALDNAPITGEWILRLDADEYLTEDLIEEIKSKLPSMPSNIYGISLKRRNIFQNKWVKHGVYPVILMRLFRKGFGRSECRLMDEHIYITEGESIVLENDFCDHNLNNFAWYCQKHINYASREAAELLNIKFGLKSETNNSIELNEQARYKRELKFKYSKKPLFWRSFAYFLYRYIIKGGMLDGKAGFLFAFFQAFWYRTLVDAIIFEIMNKSYGDTDKIRQILETEYSIVI